MAERKFSVILMRRDNNMEEFNQIWFSVISEETLSHSLHRLVLLRGSCVREKPPNLLDGDEMQFWLPSQLVGLGKWHFWPRKYFHLHGILTAE